VWVEKMRRELEGALFPFRWDRRRDSKGETAFSVEMTLCVNYLVGEDILKLEIGRMTWMEGNSSKQIGVLVLILL
jgi:hypothetical protein